MAITAFSASSRRLLLGFCLFAALIALPALVSAQTCTQLRAEELQASKAYQGCVAGTHGPCTALKLKWLSLVAAVNGQCAVSPPPPVISATDVSPDMAYGASPGQTDSGGRVLALAIAPDNKTLYAATWLAGVWKSADAGKSWRQSSLGMRNGLGILRNTTLAVDAANPRRLMFATSTLDGRSGNPFGGLWVSTDGADTWRHAEGSAAPGATGGLCPGASGDISSVAFDSGRAFVATPCGLLTNADPKLADGKWTALASTPFSPGGVIIAPNSWGNVLIACNDTSVYRSTTLGQASGGSPVWSPAIDLGGGEYCQGLSVAPLKQTAPDTVAVVHADPQGQAQLEVTVVDFTSGAKQDLGLSAQALTLNGSGVRAVFTAPRPEGQGSAPGVAYDVYAADSCGFWTYVVAPGPGAPSAPAWSKLMGPSGCNNPLHSDSWAMAIPSTYDPARGTCTAYVGTDGGVFMNSSAKLGSSTACSPAAGWVTAMAGLHTFRSYTMAGLSQPPSRCPGASSPCPALYVPSGDNDIWASVDGGAHWGQLTSAYALGDAGDVHVDPGAAGQVAGTRGLDYRLMKSANGLPPGSGNPGGQTTSFTPPDVAAGSSPGNPDLTQVLSLPSESPATPLYVAVESPENGDDVVVWNHNPTPTQTNWTPVEAPGINFPHGQIAQIRSAGGLRNTVLYVVTTTGRIFKGALTRGRVASWSPASDGSVNAEALFVDPYDANVAYESDLGDPSATPPVPPSVKATKDGGGRWAVDHELTAIATNGGEFQSFSCRAIPQNVPASACYPMLTDVYFDRAETAIRAASTYPGGVAFSGNAGANWTALLVTNNRQPSSRLENPIGLPASLFFDDTPNPKTGQPSLYVALRGRGVIRIDAPFTTLGPSAAAP